MGIASSGEISPPIPSTWLPKSFHNSKYAPASNSSLSALRPSSSLLIPLSVTYTHPYLDLNLNQLFRDFDDITPHMPNIMTTANSNTAAPIYPFISFTLSPSIGVTKYRTCKSTRFFHEKVIVQQDKIQSRTG